MFKFLGVREQVQAERTKNQALLSRCNDIEDAVIELAGIIVEEDGTDGEAILEENIGE